MNDMQTLNVIHRQTMNRDQGTWWAELCIYLGFKVFVTHKPDNTIAVSIYGPPNDIATAWELFCEDLTRCKLISPPLAVG